MFFIYWFTGPTLSLQALPYVFTSVYHTLSYSPFFRNMVRNVRLGHGLFHLINQERLAKQHAVENAIRERSERLKREWQPAKVDAGSGGESTDDELAEDVDLRK
jgi:hypothetical protein